MTHTDAVAAPTPPGAATAQQSARPTAPPVAAGLADTLLSPGGGESRPGARAQAAGSAPRVVGLDLSLTATGLSDATRTWLITSKGSKTATLADRQVRLHNLALDIMLAVYDPDRPPHLVVIEGPSFGQARQGGQHDRAGLWWMTVDAIAVLDIPIVEIPPATLKTYATGKGNASKDQVLAAVVRRYPDVEVTDNNTADALVLAAMGMRALGDPVDDLPAAHLRAMTKVAWPVIA